MSASEMRPVAPEYEEALDLLFDEGLADLEAHIAQYPDVVTTRSTRSDHHYCGYFHGATLLHHVGGNPLIRPLRADMVDRAAVLIAAGAEVDAATLPGPSQPDDIGWTTLGLVASSAEARRAGIQQSLMDELLAAGADPDARGGGCLMGALYYGETDAAEHLARRGARLDLIAAAAVEDTAALTAHLAGGPEAIAGAPRLVHYARVAWPEHADATDATRDILGMALIYAALHGRVRAITMLADAGADPRHVPPFEHHATPLHWAAMGDRPEAVHALLAVGADPEARDGEFGSTPLGWAEHLGRPAAAAALRDA